MIFSQDSVDAFKLNLNELKNSEKKTFQFWFIVLYILYLPWRPNKWDGGVLLATAAAAAAANHPPYSNDE